MPIISSSSIILSGAPDVRIERGAEYNFSSTLASLGDMTTIQFSLENKPDWVNFSE